MRRARILAVAAAVGLLLAAPAPPAAADGLGQFQDMLRQAPHGVLSYESGKALGDNGFILEDVTVKPPPEATEGVKAEPIHIDRITVDDFDFASYRQERAAEFRQNARRGHRDRHRIVRRLRFARADRPRHDHGRFSARLPGRSRAPDNGAEPARTRPARSWPGSSCRLALDGIDPDDRDPAASASLRNASLVFEDRSLLGTALPAAARARGIDPEKLAKLAEAMLDSLRPGQGPAATAVLDALAALCRRLTGIRKGRCGSR